MVPAGVLTGCGKSSAGSNSAALCSAQLSGIGGPDWYIACPGVPGPRVRQLQVLVFSGAGGERTIRGEVGEGPERSPRQAPSAGRLRTDTKCVSYLSKYM